MKLLWRDWPRLQKRIERAPSKLLLLDFDGTLAPIAKAPHAVALSREMRARLRGLSALAACRVAVISGRSLGDVRSHFSLSGFIYVGNHGLEMEGDGITLPAYARKTAKLAVRVRSAAKKLKPLFRGLPGVWVEDKGLTLSLHFRDLPKKYAALFKMRMAEAMSRRTPSSLVWKKGKKVWELRPRSEGGKGRAALFLSKKFPRALPIVIGDDVTDEDMFKALKRRGILVRVGRSGRSAADYYLRSPREVGKFLERLCR
jgi:trehalose 6-phosphate phosphatase